ncbi:MAG: phosphoethanolamine transferase domain-containing protein, partial [Arcobacteraceae bacterium]
MNKITQYKLIVYVSILLTLLYNISFFQNVINTYTLNGSNILFIFSLVILITTLSIILLSIFSSKYTLKPILITIIVVSAFANYFMNTYHIVIDDSMIRNSLQTNLNESLDLFSLELVINIFLLAVVPSFVIYKLNIKYGSYRSELFSKIKTIVLSSVLLAIMLMSFSQHYATFFREHKSLRYYVNPTYWIYSIGKYINLTLNSGPIIVKKLTNSATITREENKPHKLIIMVVGEAARADHFSLNDYEKETNPLLKNEDIINLSNTYSCGTSTAVSVPCMFSIFNKDNYSYKKGITNENVLDVLHATQKI